MAPKNNKILADHIVFAFFNMKIDSGKDKGVYLETIEYHNMLQTQSEFPIEFFFYLSSILILVYSKLPKLFY